MRVLFGASSHSRFSSRMPQTANGCHPGGASRFIRSRKSQQIAMTSRQRAAQHQRMIYLINALSVRVLGIFLPFLIFLLGFLLAIYVLLT